METYVAHGTTNAPLEGLNMGRLLLGRLADLEVCAHVHDPSQGVSATDMPCIAARLCWSGPDAWD